MWHWASAATSRSSGFQFALGCLDGNVLIAFVILLALSALMLTWTVSAMRRAVG
jgi:hypothetical protein